MREKRQFTFAWVLFGLVHCIDAWGCSRAVPLMPACAAREALVACGRILCQPVHWLCAGAPHPPKDQLGIGQRKGRGAGNAKRIIPPKPASHIICRTSARVSFRSTSVQEKLIRFG